MKCSKTSAIEFLWLAAVFLLIAGPGCQSTRPDSPYAAMAAASIQEDALASRETAPPQTAQSNSSGQAFAMQPMAVPASYPSPTDLSGAAGPYPTARPGLVVPTAANPQLGAVALGPYAADEDPSPSLPGTSISTVPGYSAKSSDVEACSSCASNASGSGAC